MLNFEYFVSNLKSRIKSPILVILGSPRLVCDLATHFPEFSISNFQLDLHQTQKLEIEAESRNLKIQVFTKPDLWDVPEKYPTVLFPVMKHGERELKLDMLEQSIQVLEQGGMLASLSEYERDSLLPKWHKKIYGKCSSIPAQDDCSLFWSFKDTEPTRRRHEIVFHARIKDGPSRVFRSWPGVFSYGRMDDGARALLDCAEIRENDAVLDLGCGIGTNGILISHLTNGPITFVDSNVRACELTRINAEASELKRFQVLASSTQVELEPNSQDVVLANPPYYGQSLIVQKFLETSHALLKPGGRLYLVTKMINEVGAMATQFYPEATYDETRGYNVIKGIKE
ncbi:methyltransferase [Telmatocola sphagniphila]|uniref:Methyltransferase n=1 Tax=Telmatocola sphagniphila TaxID=1123043 RepID=A0A8E6EVY2_9BACT|nr:methyltransferase [Telmatocola sphagniphila]QVL33385.1 methyltransferase [Telmatocola sphagniphila]